MLKNMTLPYLRSVLLMSCPFLDNLSLLPKFLLGFLGIYLKLSILDHNSLSCYCQSQMGHRPSAPNISLHLSMASGQAVSNSLPLSTQKLWCFIVTFRFHVMTCMIRIGDLLFPTSFSVNCALCFTLRNKSF